MALIVCTRSSKALYVCMYSISINGPWGARASHQNFLLSSLWGSTCPPPTIFLPDTWWFGKFIWKQGRNQLGGRGGRPPPPVKSWPPPSKMWLFIVLARRKCEKLVLSLSQLYDLNHNTSKVNWIIINTISGGAWTFYLGGA